MIEAPGKKGAAGVGSPTENRLGWVLSPRCGSPDLALPVDSRYSSPCRNESRSSSSGLTGDFFAAFACGAPSAGSS